MKIEQKGYGHFKVTITHEGKELSAITTNTEAIDAANDDCYDDEDNSDQFYETQQEAIDALTQEVLRTNEIEQ